MLWQNLTIGSESANIMHDQQLTDISHKGTLYVVSTPIGNLDDITIRGINQLKNVDAIACEDKRHSLALLRHLGIEKPLLSYHEHSSERDTKAILARLERGESLALISDAGTPLVADPGYKLLQTLHKVGVEVVPVPGVTACIAALSVSGLPTDRFNFIGFLPPKKDARRRQLKAFENDTPTLIFYESPHRIIESLQDLCEVLGEQRRACIAREITKRYETILRGSLSYLVETVQADADQKRGEFVVLVEGNSKQSQGDQTLQSAKDMLPVLLGELPLKQASALAAKLTGAKKNAVYELALSLKDNIL